MARPERNNVDYFPFYCEEGNKMFYIEETYGNDGFATFIKLLRELAKTNYHYLDLSKPTTIMFLSAKCKVSKETLLAIIKDLVELGKFDSFLWHENSIIWCQNFVDSIQDAYSRRNNNCITYDGLLQHLISLGIHKPSFCDKKEYSNTQSIVEYIKEEEIKEKEIKENNILLKKETKKNISFDYRKNLLDYGFDENLVNDWVLVRKNKKATNTETSFKKFITQIELANEDKNDILKFIIEKDWKGFEYQWLLNLRNEFKKQQQNGKQPKSNEEIFTAAMQSEVGRNFSY